MGDWSVQARVAAQCAANPSATAIECAGARLTYAQLDERAGVLAHALVALGVRAGVPVGVCAARSAGLPVALLGVLRAGGAYIPIDPAHPALRLCHMLDDAGVRVALVDGAGARALDGALGVPDAEPGRNGTGRTGKGALVLLLVDEVGCCALQAEAGSALTAPSPLTPLRCPPAAAAPGAAADATDSDGGVAYALFTSGSSGAPKAVAVGHRALAACVSHFGHTLRLGEAKRWVAVSPMVFDISGLELWLPLCYGQTLVLASGAQARSGPALLLLLKQALLPAGFAPNLPDSPQQATPATFQLLVQVGWRGSSGLVLGASGEVAIAAAHARSGRE
ncbi:hypothetical protein T492DRAFT_913318 [Pavlovales sp. CCMP2436]|nr:hypothetical protein T492DRAFT_913318 [Pavlovales sp. CCMP2436]